MAQAVKMEEKRKEHFWEKKAHHEALRQEQLELMERERLLKVHQNTLQEQRLAMILNATRRQEEERKEDLLAKFELEEENVQRVRAARSGSNVVAHEKQRLRLQMKLENVERIKRIAEYRRLETLRKIHEGDRRIQEMIERRERTVQTRKANAIVVKRKKDRLMESWNELGVTRTTRSGFWRRSASGRRRRRRISRSSCRRWSTTRLGR